MPELFSCGWGEQFEPALHELQNVCKAFGCLQVKMMKGLSTDPGPCQSSKPKHLPKMSPKGIFLGAHES